MTQDLMIEKIQKLLALSNSSNAAEASLAAAKAQELMFKYSISQLQLSTNGHSTTSPLEHLRRGIDPDNIIGRRDRWARELFWGICRSNFCRAVYHPVVREITLIGSSHDLEFVEYLYDYLVRTIDRLGRARRDQLGLAGYFSSSGEKVAWLQSFYLGAVSVIVSRLQDQRRSSEQSVDSKSLALIVVTDQALVKKLQELFSRTNSSTAAEPTDASGYVIGRRAGQSISLNRPLADQRLGVKQLDSA